MTEQNQKNPGNEKPDPPPISTAHSQAQEKLKQRKENLKPPKDKEEQAKKIKEGSITSAWRRLIHNEADEISEQLIKYAIQAFESLVLFGLFFFTSVVAELLCRFWPEISIMIIIKIIITMI